MEPHALEIGAVSAIRVYIGPPTKAGRLYPRYDKESGILAVESSVAREWRYGLDIDGRLVFDLDNDRLLANFDLHIPKERWVRDLALSWPATVPLGNLIFTSETIAQQSVHSSLRVRSDPNLQQVQIDIGSNEADAKIALSERCIALLARNELAGFLVKNFA